SRLHGRAKCGSALARHPVSSERGGPGYVWAKGVRETEGSAMKRLAVLASLLLLGVQSALGCPVCFGAPDSPMTKGATSAVWFLLGIIGFVQIGFVALFVTFWRRAKAMKKFREQFHLIEGGAR